MLRNRGVRLKSTTKEIWLIVEVGKETCKQSSQNLVWLWIPSQLSVQGRAHWSSLAKTEYKKGMEFLTLPYTFYFSERLEITTYFVKVSKVVSRVWNKTWNKAQCRRRNTVPLWLFLLWRSLRKKLIAQFDGKKKSEEEFSVKQI